MSRKAEAGSRRPPRPRPLPEAQVSSRSPRKNAVADTATDSDFGLALTLCPALRRRTDA